MKKLSILLLFTLFSLINGCKQLGITKQCWTCTTKVSTTASSGTLSTYSKDVCGDDERTSYINDNRGIKNGAFLFTECVEKK